MRVYSVLYFEAEPIFSYIHSTKAKEVTILDRIRNTGSFVTAA